MVGPAPDHGDTAQSVAARSAMRVSGASAIQRRRPDQPAAPRLSASIRRNVSCYPSHAASALGRFRVTCPARRSPGECSTPSSPSQRECAEARGEWDERIVRRQPPEVPRRAVGGWRCCRSDGVRRTHGAAEPLDDSLRTSPPRRSRRPRHARKRGAVACISAAAGRAPRPAWRPSRPRAKGSRPPGRSRTQRKIPPFLVSPPRHRVSRLPGRG